MPKKQARPRKYESFAELDPGQIVHLRFKDDDESDPIQYRDARYTGGGSFYLVEAGFTELVSDKNYSAWSRHRS